MDAMMYILIMSNDINKIILNVNGVRDYSRKLFWVAIP